MITPTGQTIAILGCGRSGVAAARLALASGAGLVVVFDTGEPERSEAAAGGLRAAGVEVVTGPEALWEARGRAREFSFAVVSPGIDLAAPLPKAFSNADIEVIGEVEFAFRHCPAKVVAITGTNGKTTTTEMLARIANGCGLRAVAAGNYGLAYAEVALDEITPDVVVLEISSFQLESLNTFRAGVSVWLNFAPDHLDRYDDVDDYKAAKLHIFDRQTEGDTAIIRAGEDVGEIAPKRVSFSSDPKTSDGTDYVYKGGKIHYRGEEVIDFRATGLRGVHNAENLMAALGAGRALGFEFEQMGAAIAGYRPPSHRCELVGEIDGYEFFNDSKATNLHALESSLKSQEGKVVLIAGGKEKGLDYEPLTGLIAERVYAVITIGEIAEKLAGVWAEAAPCQMAASLDEAVAVAAATVARFPHGTAVLFSPGTSSFDMFSGYEERGDAFRRAFLALPRSSQLKPTHEA